MATRKVIIMECDLCKSTKNVETHTVAVDNHAVELEACRRCWQDTMTNLAVLDRVGRTPKGKRRRRETAVEFPGEKWLFTHHALMRLGQRKIAPMEAVKAVENAETTTPGDDPETEVRIAAGIKAVVNPHTRVILTVAYRDESDKVA